MNTDHQTTELILFIENDDALYKGRTVHIHASLDGHRKKRRYDRRLALRAFETLAEDGAKRYANSIRIGSTPWDILFPTIVRKAAARHLRDRYEEEVQIREMN